MRFDADVIDWPQLDASVLGTLAHGPAPRVDAEAQRIDIATVRKLTQDRLEATWQSRPDPIAPLEVIRAVCGGLPGPALLSMGALACDTLDEIALYFGVTPKTLRERLRSPRLGRDDSERVLRLGRVALAAAATLGGFDPARRYLRTRNFALGGAAPLDLLQTADGERLVLDELQVHADSGPL